MIPGRRGWPRVVLDVAAGVLRLPLAKGVSEACWVFLGGGEVAIEGVHLFGDAVEEVVPSVAAA
jgi:hypothetical protein